MAHIHIAATPGVTIDGFRAVAAKHNPPQDIDGLLAWAAGTDENGLHVVTVWQSKAHMDRWSAEQLFPAFQSLGMTDVASNMGFTEYDADGLYIRGAPAQDSASPPGIEQRRFPGRRRIRRPGIPPGHHPRPGGHA